MEVRESLLERIKNLRKGEEEVIIVTQLSHKWKHNLKTIQMGRLKPFQIVQDFPGYPEPFESLN